MAANGLAPAVLLTIAWVAPVSGQQPAAQPPVFGTDVRVVAVPVFVTDRSGRAVGGLSAADFELEDQGKKVPLVAFLEVDAAADTPAGAEAGPLVQASARRQFLFLFDLTFSTPTGIMRAREAALDIVRESLLPSDLAAVATFGQRGIQILVTFTPDHSQLERAIATLGLTETQPPPRDMLSIAYDLGLPRWGPGIGPPPAEDADRIESHLMSMSRQMARADQAVYKQHVDGFLDGLEQLVRTLDAVQGRKQVVLLSAGFDSSVIAGATGQLDSSRRYYVLAFEPLDARGKPDKLRRLKVRVRGDGLQVSHRRGYVLADPKREASPTAAALQAGEAIAKGLTGGELELRAVAVPYRNTRGALALPVILEIDGRRLSESKAKQLGLEVFGYAFDGEGHILDNMTLSPTLDLAAVRPALEAKGLQVITSFLVPEGPVDLRFLVREKASKRAGSLRLRLEVPAFDGDATVLSPPLLIDDPRARLVVPAPSRGLPQLEIPFRMGEQPFTADPLPTLVNGSTRELCVMAWSRAGGAPDDTIEARLVDASGGEHALALAGEPRVFADADGTTRYVLTLAPKDVPKGRYLLRLGFGGTGSPAAPRSELAVKVE